MINKNSKIVISGANGAVGEILYNTFLKQDYQVEKLNLNDENSKDVFIHLAAKTVGTQDILNSNIEYLKQCIEYCKKVGIRYFVFFSTVSVYGNVNSLNINESSSFSNNANIYGLSKLLGEELLKEEDFKVLNLRLPAILTKNTTNTFIYKLQNKIVNNEDITITNSNKIFNNIIDVASIFDFICNYSFEEKNDTYLLASKQEKTLKEVVEFLIKENNSSSKIIESPQDSNFYNIDISKAKQIQNFKEKDIFQVLEKWLVLLKGK